METVNSDGGKAVELPQVNEVLDSLTNRKLFLQFDKHYLALAVLNMVDLSQDDQ